MEAALQMGCYICLLPLAMNGVVEATEIVPPSKESELQQAGQFGSVCAPFIAGISLAVTLAIWRTVCVHRDVEYPEKKALHSEVQRSHIKTPQDQRKGTKPKNPLSQTTAFEASCRQRRIHPQEAPRSHEGRRQSLAADGGRGRKLVSALVPPPRPHITSPTIHSVDGNVGASHTACALTADEASATESSFRPPPGLSPLHTVPSSSDMEQKEEDHQRQCSEEQNRLTETAANKDKEDAFAVLVAAVNASIADIDKAAGTRAASSRAASHEEQCLPVAEAKAQVAGHAETEPSSEPSELPSRGADKHAQGECTPCYFFSTSRGCQWGSDCGFCHAAHAKEIKQRPSKARRERTRKLVDSLVVDNNSGQAVETLTSQSQHMNERNRRYLNQVMVKKLSRLEGDHLDETKPLSQAGCNCNSSSSKPIYVRQGAQTGHSGNRLEKPHTRAGKRVVYQPASAGNSKKSMHCMWYFSV